MKWQLVCIDGRMALLADANTKQLIWLKGKIGYDKGVEALEKYARECWSSKKFRSNGFCITKGQFEQLTRTIRDVEGFYWLGSPCSFTDTDRAGFGVRRVNYGYVRIYYLFISNGDTDASSNGVRPAVILQPDIMIEDDNNLVALGTEEDKMSAQAQNSDVKKQSKSMIVEQEKKIAEQKEMLEKMKALLSKL